jgi:hypothetical protein
VIIESFDVKGKTFEAPKANNLASNVLKEKTWPTSGFNQPVIYKASVMLSKNQKPILSVNKQKLTISKSLSQSILLQVVY